MIQRAHGVANGLPVLVANRVGFEADHSEVGDGIQFWGVVLSVGRKVSYWPTQGKRQSSWSLSSIWRAVKIPAAFGPT